MVKELLIRFVPSFMKEGIVEDLISPLLVSEWGRRASWGALSLFALLLGVSLYQMVATWHDDLVMIDDSPAVHAISDNTLQAINAIPQQHLFGQPGTTDGLPITSLQLRLVGVIKSDHENLSRVIISEAGQPGKVYGIGDSLPSGIVINAITDDGVVLENGGHFEKLPLPRTALAFQGMPKALLVQEE